MQHEIGEPTKKFKNGANKRKLQYILFKQKPLRARRKDKEKEARKKESGSKEKCASGKSWKRKFFSLIFIPSFFVRSLRPPHKKKKNAEFVLIQQKKKASEISNFSFQNEKFRRQELHFRYTVCILVI